MKLASIAEVQLILCKDCASREQNHQACLNVMPSRRQSYAKIVQIERRTTSLLDRYAEVQLILCKNTFFSSHRQTSWIILMQIAQTVPQIINLPQITQMHTDYFHAEEHGYISNTRFVEDPLTNGK